MRSCLKGLFAVLSILVASSPSGAQAAAPPSSGAHPRLFMSAANVTAYAANAKSKGTAAAALVSRCQETIDSPNSYSTRGGADGDAWPGAAMSCAFAYSITNNASYLTQALKYWKAALNDDQALGDNLGCVAGVNTNWQTWDGSDPRPPLLITVTHDTGYPIRWYGPDVALTYDWLYNAPGVDEALRSQTRTCLGAWVDWYSKSGYLHDMAGANYNAGFVIAKTMAAVAIGTDGGTDGHLWTETLSLFSDLLIGKGLAGSADGVGAPAGVLVGGDWEEGWQYGPLSVAEYAAAARALEENGVPLPEMDAWTNSLIVRTIYGSVPHNDAQYVGNGDFDSEQVYQAPIANQFDAVLLGPSSDQAAAWAKSMKEQQKPKPSSFFWNALAEVRTVTSQDYKTQMPPPALWYLARGTRTMYVRTSWAQEAFWAVFTSPPQLVSDHHHLAASNFVFTRGGDHLIVDPSNYGEYSTLATNALTADSAIATGDYPPSQTPWSEADLPWARGTADGVFAARADIAKAFIYSSTPSDIPYAHREWVLLPEGEVVTIDRVRTNSADRKMYVQFHVNTAGTLKQQGGFALGGAGSSQVAIHSVALSGGTPAITQPPLGDCKLSCSSPCGKCDAARFAVDEYAVRIPGPNALAIHVIDGLGASEQPATVGSLNDDNYDPAPKQNGGVIGAAIYRTSIQSYVVASSAQDGAAGTTMAYSVPGGSPSRHIVFDAPEDASGRSAVTAVAQADRCAISLTSGAGFAGHPVMFQVSSAADGCTVKENTNVAPGSPPPGGGVVPNQGGAGGTGGAGGEGGAGGAGGEGGAGGAGGVGACEKGGCSCNVTGKSPASFSIGLLALALSMFWPAGSRLVAALRCRLWGMSVRSPKRR
jgi:hypothetical protein